MMRPAEAGFALMALLSLANLGAENVVSSRPRDEKHAGQRAMGNVATEVESLPWLPLKSRSLPRLPQLP